MLKIGDPCPDFSLTDDSGAQVTRDALCADGPFVLYFYPGDFTPVCTRQACMLRDLHPRVDAAGLRVFGVSPDDQSSHDAFRARHDLPFRLLVDRDKRATAAFGATGPLGIGIRRVTYLVDGDGRIADAVTADLRLSRHEALIQRAVERYGRP